MVLYFGIIIAIILWWSDFLSRVSEPFLVVLNSLPKVALGPVIIIWVGAGMPAIIVMALSISLIVTILEILNGFLNTDKEKIKMARTFGANKFQILTKIVIPSNLSTFINSLKINIGLSLVGVISGEFLVSKAGLRLPYCLWWSSISTRSSYDKCNYTSFCSSSALSEYPYFRKDYKEKIYKLKVTIFKKIEYVYRIKLIDCLS